MAKNRNSAATTNSEVVEDIDDMDDLLPGEGGEEKENPVIDVAETTPEVSADGNSADPVEETSQRVGDLANTVLEGMQNTVATEILSPDTLPANAFGPKIQIAASLAMLEAYNSSLTTFTANTSGKEKKAELYIQGLTEFSEDSDGFAMRTRIAELDEQIAALEKLRDTADEEFAAHVDGILSQSDEFWDDATAKLKYDELTELYTATRKQRANATDAVDSYNKFRKPGTDAIPTIEHFVPPVEKPGGGVAKDSTSSKKDGGTNRAPHIAKAEIKLTGEDTYSHITRGIGKPDADGNYTTVTSNCATVAHWISEHSGAKLDMSDVMSKWIIANGADPEAIDKDKIAIVSEFTIEHGGKSYDVRLTRKAKER